MKFADLFVESIESSPFNENTYVAYREGQADCVVFDPGMEPNKILAFLEKNSLTPVAIYNTHGHSDHIAGNESMKERWPDIPLIIGHGDAEKLTDPQLNLSGPFGLPMVSPPADELVREGDKVQYAGIELDVAETPGHSVGHVVFIYRNSPVVVFGGDVLFAGSVGRTDFPDGSHADLVKSIHEKLFTLPEDTVVLPGHGFDTTVGAEISGNPFVGIPAGYSRGS